jgi:hypothetical protein
VPGAAVDAADARDGHARCARRSPARLRLRLGGRREQQLVVVAAGQRAFALQRSGCDASTALRGTASTSIVAPTAERRSMCARSPSRPSDTSIALVATPRSAMPSATRGCGCSIAMRTCSNASPVSDGVAAKAFEREPRVAERAAHVQVVAHARARAQQGLAGRHLAEHGDADVERALRGVAADQLAAVRRPARSRPRAKPARKASSTRGKASASVNASGRAPQAARSLRFTASALWPSRCGKTVDRKCRPSTSMSL